MANSRAGNYQLEFLLTGFTTPTREHKHAIYVAPTTNPVAGTLPTAIDIQLKGGGTKTLQEVADQYCSFLRNMYPAAISIENFTLWLYVTNFSKDFISAGVAVPTTSGTGAVQERWQDTLTYRTAGGNILKQIFLESNTNNSNASLALVPNASGAAADRMAAYLLSVDGAAIGIDNTFPVAPLKRSRGENENIFNKIYRP